ncbi:hypothetical protein CLHUN_23180 [Ruminiclostridium hungatei]|uniref:BNR/Asp-box repeat protein n=1 Tax=Ruminiclostridium hungatei TaxID=48256 RepID=A0A1V4SKR6_RUMHU|nr:hypothetical protein [Ruminiclostridium hungatei]OPX43837.1 hypothetical protein CLHUN_23180 [Ruminiclostridium hungatei]
MATSTNNYNLTKPSPEDFYDIEVQNENMEVIDGKLKELETGVDEVQTQLGVHMGDYVRNAGFGVTGGTLTAYILTLTPAPTVYIDGQQFTILPHIDCGTTPSLNINGLGALTILKQDGSAVAAGDIKANKPLALVRVGSNFFMRSGSSGDVGFFAKYIGNTDWDLKYDAIALPQNSAPAWTKTTSGSPTESVAGGILSCNSGNTNGNNISYTSSSGLVVPSKTKKVTFRVKVSSGSTNGAGFRVYINDGVRVCLVAFRSSGDIIYYDGSGYITLASGFVFSSYFVGSIELSSGSGLKVFINDVQAGSTISYNSVSYAGSQNYISFGAYNDSTTSIWDLDYINYVLDFEVENPITLVNRVTQGSYIHSNENVQLTLDSAQSMSVDFSTPTSIASSSFLTSGSARPQVLVNGWIVVPVMDETNKTIIIRVSKNGGVDWETLCTISNGTVNSSGALSVGSSVSIGFASSGNSIYVLAWRFSSSGSKGTICLWTIDASTQTNTNIYSMKRDIEEQNTIGAGCYLVMDSTLTLQATWCSKNATYANSFNIRYSKSIDGGYLWATPTQITNVNTSGYDRQYPVLVMKANNPIIIYNQTYSGSANCIMISYYNGSSWVGTDYGSNILYNGGSFGQYSSSATVTSDGAIHVVWYGVDSSSSGTFNIFYSKSTNGGVSWSTGLKLTFDTSAGYSNYTPTIVGDLNNNLWVNWHHYLDSGSTWSKIYKVVYTNSSSSWSSVTAITSNSSGRVASPSFCDNCNNFTEPLCVYQDNVSNAVKLTGIFDISSTQQIIPSINNAVFGNQIMAMGMGTLKTLGNSLKRYNGFVSRKSKGWS